MLCAKADTHASGHHASGQACEEETATTPLPGPKMNSGTAGHDCSEHDAAVREAATTIATRADGVAAPSPLIAIQSEERV